MQLMALDTDNAIEDMNIPGYGLHQLKGRQKNFWFFTVNWNWRMAFEFTASHAYIFNYEDYH